MVIKIYPKNDSYSARCEPEEFTMENIEKARTLLEMAFVRMFNEGESAFIFDNKPIPYEQ